MPKFEGEELYEAERCASRVVSILCQIPGAKADRPDPRHTAEEILKAFGELTTAMSWLLKFQASE